VTEQEKLLAKRAARRLLRDKAPGMNYGDQCLLQKYPRHTLEEAREIESTCLSIPTNSKLQPIGFVSGFEMIMAQERGCNLWGDHT
jgi:hypothetical protein